MTTCRELPGWETTPRPPSRGPNHPRCGVAGDEAPGWFRALRGGGGLGSPPAAAPNHEPPAIPGRVRPSVGRRPGCGRPRLARCGAVHIDWRLVTAGIAAALAAAVLLAGAIADLPPAPVVSVALLLVHAGYTAGTCP